MSAAEVDAYLAGAPEPQRTTLLTMRAMISELLPEAEQGIAYGIPCFTVGGAGVAGFAYFTNHNTYFPMSGSITAELADELADYTTAKGSLRFATDEPLPRTLVATLIEARRREIERTAT
jgi:uncharacterized protein YdhG (YjbR/CyaY superfamily)